MKKQVTVEGNLVVVILNGSMYTEDADKLRPELLEYIAKGYSQFSIDMGSLDYIDSAGIATLIAVHKGVSRLGGSITLRRIKGVVKELFEMTRLGEVFQIQD